MKKILKKFLKSFVVFILIVALNLSGVFPKIRQVQAAITYQTPGALAYSAASGTSVAPAYPASIAAGDLLVLIIGMKPSTANGGTVTTPAGWTLITSLTGAGGYGTTLGADTGNTNVFAYYKIAAGTESGTLSVTIGTNNVSWGQIYRLSNGSGLWSVAGTTGSDSTGDTAVSIAMSANPGVTAGDFILGAMVIPTDVTTPAQFSAEGLTEAGITFGAVTEISEPDSTNGNDIGGFTYRSPVSSGTSTGVPTLTATAGGTVTNVRGPGVFIRIRELPKTTLGSGSDPATSTLAPGSATSDAGAFTLQTNLGSDSVTAITVILAGAGTPYDGLSEVRVTSDDGATMYFSAISNPSSNTLNFSGGTAIPVTTTLTQFHIRVTPKTHANMASPPGASYDISPYVSVFTSTNPQAGSDSNANTLTIDNLSPSSATNTGGASGNAQVTFDYTTSSSSDFSRSVVLRWSSSSAGSEVPVEGQDYSVNSTIGTATVACVRTGDASSTSVSGTDGGGSGGCSSTVLTNGQAYTYRVFQKDSSGNYDTGANIGTFTPALISVTITTDGIISYGFVASSASKSTVQLSDTQTAKNDGSASENFNIKTSTATGGTAWTIGSSPGTDVFVHEFSTNGGGVWTKFPDSTNYQTLSTGVGVNSLINFDLRITVPQTVSDYQQKNITVTIQAVSP